MRSRLVVCLIATVNAACATPDVPEKQTDAASAEAPRERCNTVLTGSRIPQCNRGDVKVITAEELERDPRWIFNPEPYGGPQMPRPR